MCTISQFLGAHSAINTIKKALLIIEVLVVFTNHLGNLLDISQTCKRKKNASSIFILKIFIKKLHNISFMTFF